MGIVLRKSFSGRHFWVKNNQFKLDSMFFSATEEDIFLYNEDYKGKSVDYLTYDTIIMCNPNAMAYQHMINYPHAYYLKYFLNKQINCMVWNYPGYGRSDGTPDPTKFGQHVEMILDFLKNKIGVKGKIAVYGRSLGNIPTTHI